MKRLLAILICIGLLGNSGTIIAQTPKQKILKLWKCRPSKTLDPECSEEDRRSSKKWLAGAAAVALAAVFAGLGIAVSAAQIKKEQEAAKAEPSMPAALAAIGKQIDPALSNQYHKFEVIKRNHEAEFVDLRAQLATLRAQQPKDEFEKIKQEELIKIQEKLIKEKEKDLVRINNQMQILRSMMGI